MEISLEHYIKKAVALAQSNKQAVSLAHLYVVCLQDTPCRFSGIAKALEQIKQQLAYTDLSHTSQPDNKNARFFLFDKAQSDYRNWYKNRPLLEYECESILAWLLESNFTDPLQKNCREICQLEHIDALTFSTKHQKVNTIAELGFGESIDSNWLHRHSRPGLFNREKDLKKHLALLALALKQRRHYLIVGQPGVGKTVFLHKLLAKIADHCRCSSDPTLQKIEFILFQPTDFIGLQKEVDKKLENLYDYLRGHNNIVPVFDSFEYLLNPSLIIYDSFSATFGGMLHETGRCFFLISRSHAVNGAELLKNIRSYTLPAMLPDNTVPIVSCHIQKALKKAKIPGSQLKLKTDEQTFCMELVKLAAERYPNRHFPQIALDLIDSTIDRAVSRCLFDKQDNQCFVTLDDLRDHIAEELNINPEILGKNPDHFYQELNNKLKQDVIGQDHAIDQICQALHVNAVSPPQKTPRGRFLFVGPPGVGKTELGRSMARRLGLGEEAFFIFNMSEYSGESARTRFMGSDPGYVGFKSTRTIYDMVKQCPSCVILLDEIDRAHACINDILLSIFEGQGKDAEGNMVYFSQAIFIMTTNQGQDQVCQAYQNAIEENSGRQDLDGSLRSNLFQQFTDSHLRSLLLDGSLDKTEADMKKFLNLRLQSLKQNFNIEDFQNLIQQNTVETASSQDYLSHLNSYLALKEMKNRLEVVQSKTTLDRALLDRIDFIIPFFPIKETFLLDKILQLKLCHLGWSDAPMEIQKQILNEALQEQESVRPLERLIKKYRSQIISTQKGSMNAK